MPSTIIDYIDYLEWINAYSTSVTIMTQDEFDIYIQLLNAQIE